MGMGDVLVMRQIEWNGLAIPCDGDAPETCTIRQLYGAVTDAEYAAIDGVLSSLHPRQRRAIETATEVHRTHPEVAFLIAAAGISEARRDDIWRIAQYVT